MVECVIVIIALLIGGWLLLDGARALATGSYTTPSSGTYAGQLGPWSKVAASVGLSPNGLMLKLTHIILGASWLIFGFLSFRGVPFAWWPLLLTAMLSLWYLPFGTVAGALVGFLLLLPAVRSAA